MLEEAGKTHKEAGQGDLPYSPRDFRRLQAYIISPFKAIKPLLLLLPLLFILLSCALKQSRGNCRGTIWQWLPLIHVSAVIQNDLICIPYARKYASIYKRIVAMPDPNAGQAWQGQGRKRYL